MTLSTDDGYSADWSNGGTGSSIDVQEAGTYTVTLTDDAGCSFTSDAVVIDVLEPVAPHVIMDGQLGFCEGGSVLLSGPEGGTCFWNVTTESQSIQVSTSGTFQLTFIDACGAENLSEDIVVDVYPNPEAPSTEDFTIVEPADVTLNAGGENLLWYEEENSNYPFATGPGVSAYVGATTTFWVEESESANPGTSGTGAKASRDDLNGQHHQNAGFWLVFDAFQAMTIESVKVYANGAGTREIALVDANGAVLESTTVDLPEGESTVDLGFYVVAGEGFGLRSLDDNPQLWRDGIGSEQTYPYALGDFGEITGTSVQRRQRPELLLLLLRLDSECGRCRLRFCAHATHGHRHQPCGRGRDRGLECCGRLPEPHRRPALLGPRPRRQRPRPEHGCPGSPGPHRSVHHLERPGHRPPHPRPRGLGPWPLHRPPHRRTGQWRLPVVRH